MNLSLFEFNSFNTYESVSKFINFLKKFVIGLNKKLMFLKRMKKKI